MKLLCITSLLWLNNVYKSFKKGVKIFGTVTTITTVASVNLWRNYQYNSIRRNCDVIVARLTFVYYIIYSLLNKVMNKSLFICGISTCALYLKSVNTKTHCKWYNKIWHPLFHLMVYKVQDTMIYKS